MKEPRSCKYSKGYKGTYICTLCLLPCERVKKCPLDKEVTNCFKESEG